MHGTDGRHYLPAIERLRPSVAHCIAHFWSELFEISRPSPVDGKTAFSSADDIGNFFAKFERSPFFLFSSYKAWKLECHVTSTYREGTYPPRLKTVRRTIQTLCGIPCPAFVRSDYLDLKPLDLKTALPITHGTENNNHSR